MTNHEIKFANEICISLSFHLMFRIWFLIKNELRLGPIQLKRLGVPAINEFFSSQVSSMAHTLRKLCAIVRLGSHCICSTLARVVELASCSGLSAAAAAVAALMKTTSHNPSCNPPAAIGQANTHTETG